MICAIVGDIAGSRFEWCSRLLLVVALTVVAGCKYDCGGESATPSSNDWVALTALSCMAAPIDAKLLDESGDFALYVGETAEDADSNKARDTDPDSPCRNSLFLRRCKADGADEWRVLLTTGSDWCEGAGMSEWC